CSTALFGPGSWLDPGPFCGYVSTGLGVMIPVLVGCHRAISDDLDGSGLAGTVSRGDLSNEFHE
ncbi:hypothetical protein ACFWF3_31130, partial [Nocardia sp. NPDC060220]|uniref:hypothetical protein n=1 Tax=Nocardia sp. NPDC060220 TaxID=3347076 RepID=UPI00365A669B